MSDRHHTVADDLPETVAIMVVDTKGFSRHNDVQQEKLTVLIPEVLEQACRRCNLEDLWSGRQFPDSTGDGYIIGFQPRFLPGVIDRFLDALQEELAIRLPSFKSQDMRLRMRLSLEVGPARQLNDPRVGSPVGNAMIATHRLVDAEPLRALLDNSDPDVTFLAVALSERVMHDVVEGGHTRRHVVSEFVSCPVTTGKKGFSGTAYLYVPALSGELLRQGLVGVQARTKPVDAIPAPTPVPKPSSSVKRGVSAVDGHSNTVAGRDIDQSRHDTTVHGDQYTAHRDLSIKRDRD
jgi:hypothetical protein